MSRSMTNVIPDLYEALDVVSREMVGAIPASQASMSAERAALNQVVYSPVVSALSAADTTPSVAPPDTGDNPIEAEAVTITKSRHVAVRINGEQNKALNTGVGFSSVLAGEFAQAMRTLVNEVERDVCAEYVRASRAYGTAGTTPFGTSTKLADVAQMQKILDDNGAPEIDRQLVINTNAFVNLGSLTQLTNVDNAGTADLVRRGVLSDLFGFSIRKSAGIRVHSPGGATNATASGAGNVTGTTSLTIATGGGGSLSLKAGDLISFTGIAGKYVVQSGVTAGASTTATVVIGGPGLLESVPDTTAMTVEASAFAANLAFSRSAIILATRPPAMPDSGDLASDSTMATDPVSGLTFEVRQYAQFAQTQYLVMLAWGTRCIKPNHAAILLG